MEVWIKEGKGGGTLTDEKEKDDGNEHDGDASLAGLLAGSAGREKSPLAKTSLHVSDEQWVEDQEERQWKKDECDRREPIEGSLVSAIQL